MLDDPLADFERQVEPGEFDVFLLEALDNAQGMEVVVEGIAVPGHQTRQHGFTGVPEGRMSDVVGKRQRFHQVPIQPQRLGGRAADLRHLERMRQAISKVVGITACEDLGLVFEAAECARVDDAVAVALVIVAVGVRGFGVAPPLGPLDLHGVAGKTLPQAVIHLRSLKEL